MKKTYKIEEKLTSEGSELRQPVAELEAPATKRQLMEDALRESGEKYRGIFDKVPISILLLDKDGQIVDINPYHVTNVGKGKTTREDYIGKNIITHPSVVNAGLSETYARLFKGEPFDLHDAYFPTTTGGTDAYFNIKGVPLFTDSKVIGAIIIHENITERKQVEEALRESEEFSSSLLTNSPHPVAVVNPDRSVRYVNLAFEKLTGFTSAELIGKKPPYPWWTEETLGKTTRDLEEAMSQGAVRCEELFQKKNGKRFWVEITSAPVTSNGEFKYYLSNWVDITERKRMEDELRKFKTISDKAGYGITIVNLEGNVSYVNTSFARMHGYTPDELIGKHLSIFHAEHQMANVNRLIEKLKRGGSFVSEELGHKRKDGTEFTTLMTGTLVRNENGTPLFMAGTAVDITDRKQAEEALADEATRRRILIDQSLDGIVVLDENSKVYEANQRFAEMLGYTPEEVRELHTWDWDTQWTREQLLEMGRNVDAAGYHLETCHRRKDGTTIDVEISVNGAVCAGQKLIFCVCRDITDRKKTEQALRRAEEEKTAILDSMSEVVIFQDMEHRLIWANKVAGESVDLSPEQLMGRHCYEIWHKRSQPCVGCPVAKARESGKPQEAEMTTPDGRVWFVRGYPIQDTNDCVVGVVEVTLDITQHKQAEETLQAEKNKLQSVIDALEDGLTIQDKDYNIIYQNEPVRRLWGDRTGEKCYRVYEGKDKVDHGCPVEKAFRDGKSHTSERKVVTLSGEITFWENTANPIRDADGKIVSCLEITRNITERKRMQEVLRESEEKLRKTFESVSNGISVIDLNGVITQVNQRMVEMHGFSSRDKLLGKNAFELVAPRYHEKIAKNIRKTLKQGTTRGVEYTLLKADGSEFPGELSTSLLKDASGNPVGHVTIAWDITERKEAEEREKELQKELYLSSRLASIGELAAGVAHQLNNPLTGVLGFSQRLLRKSTDQEVSQDLGRIYTEAERASKVVQNLLTFARRRQPHKQYSDINDILESALELRAYELKTSNIEVITNLASNLPQVMLDFQQIEEVFLNIILNAEQVMTEVHSGGRLTIKTEERKGHIRTTFTDDGPGIPAEHLDKIFDPFFSSRGEIGGTGLGLSVCHGIITEHGGRIYARSKLDKGATFLVELPVSTDVAET